MTTATETEYETNKEIATTILSQIGHSALYMIGAKKTPMVVVKNGVTFRVKGSRKVNYVKITLNGMDTYDIEYGKIHGFNFKVVSTSEGVYNDGLRQSIEINTGLYTSL